MTDIQRDDMIIVFNSISRRSILKTAYGVMGSSFQYAEQKGILYINPVKAAVKAKKKMERKKESAEASNRGNVITPQRPCVHSLQQISVMLYVCKEYEPRIFMALLLALTAG